jgi:hypothetical protein
MAVSSVLLDCSESTLRKLILDSFAPYPYQGPIMADEAHLHFIEANDNLDLILSGKNWTDLEWAYLDLNHDDYVLMSPVAVRAFLPAWLHRAIDNQGKPNQVRSSLVFHLNAVGG